MDQDGSVLIDIYLQGPRFSDLEFSPNEVVKLWVPIKEISELNWVYFFSHFIPL